jgi:hypothetical protein
LTVFTVAVMRTAIVNDPKLELRGRKVVRTDGIGPVGRAPVGRSGRKSAVNDLVELLPITGNRIR